jgi:DNA-binding transcriptional MerR regulator
MFKYIRSTKQFVLQESKDRPGVAGYLQSIKEALNGLKPRTITESRRLAMAKEHLKEVRRQVRRLEEQNTKLQEQVKLLEENKE